VEISKKTCGGQKEEGPGPRGAEIPEEKKQGNLHIAGLNNSRRAEKAFSVIRNKEKLREGNPGCFLVGGKNKHINGDQGHVKWGAKIEKRKWQRGEEREKKKLVR